MAGSRARAASVALGAALAAVAFGARGGADLGRTTTVEIVIVLVAGAGLAAAVLYGRPGRAHGLVVLGLFAALACLTGLSLSWSIGPDLSLEETARTFAYLAAFATAVAAARLRPSAAPVVLGGVLTASLAVAGWALLTRVWPGALAEDIINSRLSEPLEYWNALGAMAALGTPAALWLATRRDGTSTSRALGLVAIGVLVLTVLLTQSRSALAGLVLAALVWLVVVPLRLRSVVAIAVSALGVAPVAAWALSKEAFTARGPQPLQLREEVAGELGLLILAMCVALFAAGLALGVAHARRRPGPGARVRAGMAVAAACSVAALVAVGAVAVSDRGLGGAVSDRVDDLTGDSAPPAGGARLGSLSSSRSAYWEQSWDVLEERPVAGAGAGAFALASLPHVDSGVPARHAHGYVAQTMADLGLVGLAVMLALLAAWLAAAARATGLVPQTRPRPGWDTNRVAACALALCVVVYGAHSLLDWIWFVPGPTVAALVAAGFVAGLGPLGRRDESAASPAGGDPARPSPVRMVAAASVLITAALLAWAVWQPERAQRAVDDAQVALDRGDLDEADDLADRAREVDPYSPEPLWTQAAVWAARGDNVRAYRLLEEAVIEHSLDPEPWLRLGRYELNVLDLPARAYDTATAALKVAPRSTAGGRPAAQRRAGHPGVSQDSAARHGHQHAGPRPQRNHLEAHLVQQLPQRALGEEAQVGREGREAALEPARQHGHGGAATVPRGRDRQSAPRGAARVVPRRAGAARRARARSCRRKAPGRRRCRRMAAARRARAPPRARPAAAAGPGPVRRETRLQPSGSRP